MAAPFAIANTTKPSLYPVTNEQAIKEIAAKVPTMPPHKPSGLFYGRGKSGRVSLSLT